MVASNAAGEYVPPCIILPSQTDSIDGIGPNVDVDGFREAFYLTSRDGWQTNDTFLSYVQALYFYVMQ
jgi:hypothetical protein